MAGSLAVWKDRRNVWFQKGRCGPQALQITKREYLLLAVSGILIISITAMLFFNTGWAVILCSPYLFLHIRKYAGRIREKRRQTDIREFRDGMQAVSFALHAGFSIENAFRKAAGELQQLHGEQSRITAEFRNLIWRMDRNETIETLLEELAERTQIEDVQHFAEIFRYAKRSGGNLIVIIHQTAAIMGEKQDVETEIQTIISGRRLEQKVMNLVPYGIILYLRISAPEFICPVYGNEAGVLLMSACLLVYAAAGALSERMIQIVV